MSNRVFLEEPDLIRVIEINRVHRSMWQIVIFGVVMFAILTIGILGRVA